MFSAKKNTYTFVFGLFLIINLLFLSHKVSAATIVVNTLDDELNSDGDCSFHEAVVSSENNANVDGCLGSGSYGDDTIDLTVLSGSMLFCPGDLTITQSLTVVGPGSGVLSLDNPFCDQRLFTFNPINPLSTLNISGITGTYFGDQSFSGGFLGAVLKIMGGTVSLNDVTFSGSSGETGAIDVSSDSTLTVTNSTVSDGFGSQVGAIYNNGGNVTITQSNFINNVGSLSGALYNVGTMNIDTSTFDGNNFGQAMHMYVAAGGVTHVTDSILENAPIGFGAVYVDVGGIFTMDGGGILNNINPEAGTSAFENHGDSTLTNVLIDGNDGDTAIANNEGTLLLDGTTISHCIGTALGGSRTILIYDGTVTLRHSSIIDNTTAFGFPGPGIYQSGGTLRLEGTTIAHNTATSIGTGLYLAAGTTTVVNSTIANNSGTDGVGVYVDGGSLAVFNSTFANNIASNALNGANVTVNAGTASFTNTLLTKSGTGKNCKGSFTNGGHNLQYGDSTCTGITLAATNPLSILGLQDNGGSTQTIALSDTSEALDVADNAVCIDVATVNAVDQRGYVRPSGVSCDIGAFEFQVIPPDLTAPTITNITSSTTNGAYKAGGIISLQVVFSEAVTVTGTPQLTLETGASDAVVDYVSGSGTDTLIFTYTVASGQNSNDLDYADTTSLALNGGTILDGASNPADLTLPTPGTAGSLAANKNLVIDTIAPIFSGITPLSNSVITNVTDSSVVAYTLSESLSTGSITVTRTGGSVDGSSPHVCTLVGTARTLGSHIIDFSDTVNGCSSVVTLVSGAIYTFQFNGSDVATNAATTITRTNVMFAPPVLDTTAPTVTNVTSSTANGLYKAGDIISLQVVFSEAVTVTGTPQLTLETGASDAVVDYVSGSGTDTLIFTYTVASGQNSNDLDYGNTTSLALNGGSIVDGASNTADLTLATPAAIGSLAANKNLVIDTTAPIIATITAITPNPTTDTTPDFTFSSDEAGTVSYTGSCSSLTTTASLGSNTITFAVLSIGTYSNCTIVVEDLAGNLSNILSIAPFTIASSENDNQDNNAEPHHGVRRGGGGGSGPIKINPQDKPLKPIDTSPIPVVFNDIKGYKYEKDIIELTKQCELKGYADEVSKNLRNFKPDKTITRGELAIMLMKCKFGMLPNPKTITPIDVTLDDPAARYIQKGFDVGILEGYRDKTFKSGRNVIAAEALKMIELTWIPIETIKLEPINNTCRDIQQKYWFGMYYNLVLNRNVFFADSDKNIPNVEFCEPIKEITRGEIAHIILTIKDAT